MSAGPLFDRAEWAEWKCEVCGLTDHYVNDAGYDCCVHCDGPHPDDVDPDDVADTPGLVARGQIPITEICGLRDAAISKMEEALRTLEAGRALAEEARDLAARASAGEKFHLVDRSTDSAYNRPFLCLDVEAARVAFRHHTDACAWMRVVRGIGIETLMDTEARNALFSDLSGPDVPAISEENIHATIEGLITDSALIFQRGLARAFTALDRRFKSHDAFKLGSRVILTRLFSEDGFWNYYSDARGHLNDIERVLALLDGETPEPGELVAAVGRDREGGWGARQSVTETRYLRIRTYKNGNAHLWFTRDDLVEAANKVLADYYGQVLPDAVGRDEDAIKGRSGLPARDLQFYRTPDAVVEVLIRDLPVSKGEWVLEPSAGDGAIACGLLEAGYNVAAVEIDAARHATLREHMGRCRGEHRCALANFLRLPPQDRYTAVVMNPPFYGTHWAEHVTHAMDFLKPGGVLRTVLPATAEVGTSKAHEQFRAWASLHAPYGGELRWRDLPSESFAESGTRIETVILELRKP